jgi:hypothetical protein
MKIFCGHPAYVSLNWISNTGAEITHILYTLQSENLIHFTKSEAMSSIKSNHSATQNFEQKGYFT